MAIETTVSITTDSSGDATVYSPKLNGRLLSLRYEPGDIATGADLTITSETTGQSLLSLTNAGTSNIQKAPRQTTHDPADGSDAIYATGNEVRDYFWLAGAGDHSGERIKVVVAEGGDTKTGAIKFITDG